MSLSDEVIESSPRIPPLRTSSQHRPPPITLGAFQRRFRPAHCHCGVRPSGVNASRWLSENAKTSPSSSTFWTRRRRYTYLSRIPLCVFLRTRQSRERALLCPRLYMLSNLKNLVCSPRPYAPPVVRLTVGNHHLECGLPSTRSTNSTSMALFLGAHVYDFYRLGSLSTTAFATWVVGVYRNVRLHILFRQDHTRDNQQVTATPEVEKWVQSSDWSVCLLLVSQYPSPVDDCPCFEDAIAFALVTLDIITSFGARNVALIIFSWRILAKPSVQTLLPPLFRCLAWASPVRLPHRRHYMPATEYVHGPPHTLRAVPSMIDLDLAVAEVVDEDAGVASGRRVRSSGVVKRRGSPSGSVQEMQMVLLTNVVVYVGVGAIATVMVPALFEVLEWGI
ncbi:hypothetical protein EDB92DRAFT_1815843 [Lactarius akahatsu]|uniref:Uncharacterized protein n=1 Tax=Lactarius akahatsu TaxID=416441 RepID=A0AAD4LIH9_9AGAM|nr:hypothetical protein EDB92DRAFT_1815843 [Lactarius akahatsu]